VSFTEPITPDSAVLDLAAQRVEAEIGLHFAGAKRRQFEAALGRMASTLGHPSARACAAWLLAGQWDDARSALCARFLTIGETYFFREPRALDLVCDYAREHLARGEASRPLRIWSAGCCTGEEPYSIAMALRSRVPQLGTGMVSILATDLNSAYLDFARAGSYRRWSFRRTTPADQAAFFRALDDGRFEIDTSVREQIRFARLNLASGAYPSAATGTLSMDVIFCRNVLMYFGRAQIKRVVARLHQSLVDGGWLVVNASEASSELFAGFTPVYHEDAVFFRKGGRTAKAAARPVAPVCPARAAQRGPAPLKGATQARGAHSGPAAAPREIPRQHGPLAQDDVMVRARALLDGGAREEALQCLRRAVEAKPLSAPLQQGATLFALEHGERAMARDGVKRLLYLDPGSAMGHFLAAMIEDAEGRRAQALRLLQDCRRLVANVDDELRDAVDVWLERIR
jgi:chemotaxis protein methyltransferase CheR